MIELFNFLKDHADAGLSIIIMSTWVWSLNKQIKVLEGKNDELNKEIRVLLEKMISVADGVINSNASNMDKIDMLIQKSVSEIKKSFVDLVSNLKK